MKSLLILFFAFSFVPGTFGGDFPFAIGAGSDAVFLKTGVEPNWEKRTSAHPDLCATLQYDQNMRVREIVITSICSSEAAAHSPSLNGVSMRDRKEDIVAKLGKPTATFPKEEDELMDVYRVVWLLKDRILTVYFYQADDKETKSPKDTVAYMSLRAANM